MEIAPLLEKQHIDILKAIYRDLLEAKVTGLFFIKNLLEEYATPESLAEISRKILKDCEFVIINFTPIVHFRIETAKCTDCFRITMVLERAGADGKNVFISNTQLVLVEDRLVIEKLKWSSVAKKAHRGINAYRLTELIVSLIPHFEDSECRMLSKFLSFYNDVMGSEIDSYLFTLTVTDTELSITVIKRGMWVGKHRVAIRGGAEPYLF
jgi:hypothetical protein